MFTKTFLALIIFLLHLLLFPYLIVKDDPSLSYNTVSIVAYIIIIYSTSKLCYLTLKNNQRVLELSFWVFTYVFMGLTPFAHSVSNHYSWEGNYTALEELTGLSIVLIGIAAYEIGILISRIYQTTSQKKQMMDTSQIKKIMVINKKRLYVMAFLSLTLTVLLLLNFGGFSTLFITRFERSAQYNEYGKAGSLILTNLLRVPLFVCLVITIFIYKNEIDSKMKSKYYWIVFALIVLNLIISNPLSNARYWFGTLIIALFMSMFKWKKYFFGIWTIALSIFLVGVFPYSDIFRVSRENSISLNTFLYQITQSGDFDAFQQILNAVQYTKEFGIAGGTQLIGALLFFVPRSLWESKPLGSGQLISEAMGYEYTNLSLPLWGESLLNFGFLGVFFVFFLYGFLTSKLQKKFIRDLEFPKVTFIKILIPFLMGYQLFLLRGDLINGISYMSAYILFAFLFTKFLKFK
ncbi:hypothetical protein [Planococcus sp. YIM B11945]|uniref:hypothetical protein n=1 Tax=Planococcus sp. YIM B11945 TaxID=3435410 RepID=UPI003D7E2407